MTARGGPKRLCALRAPVSAAISRLAPTKKHRRRLETISRLGHCGAIAMTGGHKKREGPVTAMALILSSPKRAAASREVIGLQREEGAGRKTAAVVSRRRRRVPLISALRLGLRGIWSAAKRESRVASYGTLLDFMTYLSVITQCKVPALHGKNGQDLPPSVALHIKRPTATFVEWAGCINVSGIRAIRSAMARTTAYFK